MKIPLYPNNTPTKPGMYFRKNLSLSLPIEQVTVVEYPEHEAYGMVWQKRLGIAEWGGRSFRLKDDDVMWSNALEFELIK